MSFAISKTIKSVYTSSIIVVMIPQIVMLNRHSYGCHAWYQTCSGMSKLSSVYNRFITTKIKMVSSEWMNPVVLERDCRISYIGATESQGKIFLPNKIN